MNATLTTPQPRSDDVAALGRAVAQARQRRRNPRDHGPRRLDPRPATPRPSARIPSRVPASTTRRTSTATTAATGSSHAPRRPRPVNGPGRGDRSSAAGPSPAAGTITLMAMTFWTPEEETRLVQELRDGLTIEDIATAHQRTPTAVLARTSRLAPEDLDLRTRAERTKWLREQLLANPDYDWLAPLTATRRRQQQETRAKAPRNGAVWTTAEDEQALTAAAAGVSIRDLAAQLQRSTKSTARRIHHLAHRDDAAAPAGKPNAPLEAAPTSSTPVDPGLVSAAPGAHVSAGTAAANPTVSGPSAHGQPWTQAETSALLEQLRQGRSVADIATLHQRSIRAINGRAAAVLTRLTGAKQPLTDDSAEQLRTRLSKSTTAEVDADRDALALLHEVLGATVVTG